MRGFHQKIINKEALRTSREDAPDSSICRNRRLTLAPTQAVSSILTTCNIGQ
jgi:hypothetical protein